jgi:hypothetical protein
VEAQPAPPAMTLNASAVLFQTNVKNAQQATLLQLMKKVKAAVVLKASTKRVI